jgi:hypothetical protein
LRRSTLADRWESVLGSRRSRVRAALERYFLT